MSGSGSDGADGSKKRKDNRDCYSSKTPPPTAVAAAAAADKTKRTRNDTADKWRSNGTTDTVPTLPAIKRRGTSVPLSSIRSSSKRSDHQSMGSFFGGGLAFRNRRPQKTTSHGGITTCTRNNAARRGNNIHAAQQQQQQQLRRQPQQHNAAEQQRQQQQNVHNDNNAFSTHAHDCGNDLCFSNTSYTPSVLMDTLGTALGSRRRPRRPTFAGLRRSPTKNLSPGLSTLLNTAEQQFRQRQRQQQQHAVHANISLSTYADDAGNDFLSNILYHEDRKVPLLPNFGVTDRRRRKRQRQRHNQQGKSNNNVTTKKEEAFRQFQKVLNGKSSKQETLLVYPIVGAGDAMEIEARGGNGFSIGGASNVAAVPAVVPVVAAAAVVETNASRSEALTIQVGDYQLLEPQEYMNDTLVDFWMQWIMRNNNEKGDNNDKSMMHIFSTHFYTDLAEKGVDAVTDWMADKKIDIFEKKLLCIPIHKSLQWSMVVVVNPAHIANMDNVHEDDDAVSTDQQDVDARPASFILLLDSANNNSRPIAAIAKKIRAWLNAEWTRLYKNEELQKDYPFTPMTLSVFYPTIPYQQNDCDGAVFTCRYAYALYQLRHQTFSFGETNLLAQKAKDHFKMLITDSEAFNFDEHEIQRLRTEIKTLVEKLSVDYASFKVEEKRQKKVSNLDASTNGTTRGAATATTNIPSSLRSKVDDGKQNAQVRIIIQNQQQTSSEQETPPPLSAAANNNKHIVEAEYHCGKLTRMVF